MNELKPCPFCGVVPEVFWRSYKSGDMYYITCGTCLLAKAMRPTRSAVIATWNTRAPQAEEEK